MIPGYVPAHGNTLVMSRQTIGIRLNFVAPTSTWYNRWTRIQGGGTEAIPGDVALAVQTSKWGTSFAVYHLRYAGNAGALTVTTTHYGGHADDSTFLTVMTRKANGRSPS